MDKLLVSACLLGTPCRYDGKSKADARVQALVGKYEIVPVCPNSSAVSRRRVCPANGGASVSSQRVAAM